MKKTLIVNLLGGPGCGKSTGAAYIFSQLKMREIDAELVTEFAKDKTWEHNDLVLSNQFYVFGKQAFRLGRVYGQVDVIITDSPLILSNVYAKNMAGVENFKKACADLFNSYNNLNFFLERVKKYNPNGRKQKAWEAEEISYKIKDVLFENNIPYITVNGDISGYNIILERILERLNETI